LKQGSQLQAMAAPMATNSSTAAEYRLDGSDMKNGSLHRLHELILFLGESTKCLD
jgi:hypothetical protein